MPYLVKIKLLLNDFELYNEPNYLRRFSTLNLYLSGIRKVANLLVPPALSLWQHLSIFRLKSWPLEWTSPCRLDHGSSSVLLLVKFSPASLKCGFKSLPPIPLSSYLQKSFFFWWYFQWNGTCIIVVASRLCRKCNRIKQERNHRCRMMMRRMTSLVRVSRSSCLSFSLRNT